MSELEELKETLAAVNVGAWWWDIAKDTIRWSDVLCTLFGRGSDDPPPTFESYLQLLLPDDRERVQKTISDAMSRAKEQRARTTYVVEHRLTLPSGAVRWIEGRGRVDVDDEGAPATLTGCAYDITERRLTDERLRHSEEVHRLFSELASDYVYVVDYQKPALFPEIVGGSFERTTGLTPAQVEAKGGWWQMIHPDDRAALGAVLPSLEQGKPVVTEYRIVDGSGSTRWLRDSVRPVADESGKLVKLMGGVREITDRKELELQLLQAQKLEAMARLAGGIAHDFNNLLSVIMGSVALIRHAPQSESAIESCTAILEAAQRGAELTRSLLVFARRDAGAPQLCEVADVIREAIPMVARAVGPDIAVRFVAPESPCPVRIDRGQAQLLLLNLAVNARDAMPRGGELRLTLSGEVLGAGGELPSELKAGPWVRMEVSDDGVGIDPEVMARLFEPFFTTKPEGKGTGLGLAACHGIAVHAGGAIKVASTVGKGATFTIFLPMAASAGAFATSATPSQARTALGGNEHILLVEDEPQLQKVLQRTLVSLGYKVDAYSSADAAAAALEPGGVALVVSDVILGGMPGSELVAIVQARWPGTRCLLISGYSRSITIPQGVPLLEKPFTLDRFATKVRQLLDEAREGSPPSAIGST